MRAPFPGTVLRSLLLTVAPPCVLAALVCGLWQWATWALEMPRYLLPGPVQVARAAWNEGAALWSASVRTGAEAVCGWALSLAAGLLLSLGFSQSRIIRNSMYPYAIFLQTVPIVAIAPLIVTWCGTGFQSVVLVSLIVSLFPIITNGTAGLTQVDRGLLEVFQLYGAGRWQTLCKLRLPHAMPYIVTGARTSSGVAVIGAIVGEFFAGYGSEEFGLGYFIMHTAQQLKTDLLFACVLASTLLGLLIFSATSGLGALILRHWQMDIERAV